MTRYQKFFGIVLGMILMATVLTIGCGTPAPQSDSQKLGANFYPGTLTSLLPNYAYAPMVFTATSQTKTQSLSGQACLTLTMSSTALTTVTFQAKGSNDGGASYFPLRIAPIAATLTASVSAQTATANTAYYVQVSSFTNYELVTSSTFTATNVTFQGVGSSNPCPNF
ncbi:MAG TPA: hypothetical protein VND65_18110 [Candidatus Binatia bacterium]|nr:hypothetical protein [Candidatus Binatia bacterium]